MILSWDLVEFRCREIGGLIRRAASQFDRRLGRTIINAPIKFRSDQFIIQISQLQDIAGFCDLRRFIEYWKDPIILFVKKIKSLTAKKLQKMVSLQYSDVIMSAMASQINSVPIICSIVCWGADQRKYQSSTPLAFVRGIHLSPLNYPHKGPATRKMFSFDDVIIFVPWAGTCTYYK